MELVSKNGLTYFVPLQDRNAQINGLCKWEQAFRVYAAIYSQAQPHRASEIWQYVYVINLAASSYHWNNVSFYDQAFRHMMALKPNRSWAKTYVQGWNLAMVDPLSKTNQISNGFNRNNTGPNPSGNSSNVGNGKSWKDYCCWKFNKNKCSKTATECDWDHCCTYCGGWHHVFIIAGNV